MLKIKGSDERGLKDAFTVISLGGVGEWFAGDKLVSWPLQSAG